MVYSKIGVELINAAPNRSESYGLVERLNGTVRKAVDTVTKSDHPRSWHEHLDFIMWTLRQQVNEDTGFTPYQILFGHLGGSPLTILKEKWGNELKSDPVVLKKTEYSKYMQNIQDRISTVLEMSRDNQTKSQTKYVENCNKGRMYKTFDPDDKVLILQPDSTHKHLCQWTGPVTVLNRLREGSNSYRILFPDGGIKIIHADNLRLFISDVKTVGVVFEDEEDFGNIVFTPDSKCRLDNVHVVDKFRDVDLSHLLPKQRCAVLSLLQKHEHIFSDKAGYCDWYKHKIELKEGYKPKSFRPYRIPETLKEEVSRHNDELLKQFKKILMTRDYSRILSNRNIKHVSG